MRLLNAHTLEVREVFGSLVPPYAILSHRWEEEEVTFHDLISGRGKKMIGWQKIIRCCGLAIVNKIEYVWIDSCCIDKTSSAELSEAINSMFQWYRDAEICYAYLSDVSGPLEKEANMDAFRFSKWFTRGWTLQELLAPDNLTFFDTNWKNIGTKESLRETISRLTGIQHLFNFADASIAQKMSWASKRETTRIEDQAYCLLGLFGVNMPPLYGEGLSAFLRLQLEIMKISNDESLFAWEDETIVSGGLLAISPVAFKYASDIRSLDPPWIQRPAYSMTNKGLEIVLELIDLSTLSSDTGTTPSHRIAPLNCVREESEQSVLAVILASKVMSTTSYQHSEYQRSECQTLLSCDNSSISRLIGTEKKVEPIYIKQPQVSSGIQTYCHFQISARSLFSAGWEIKYQGLLNPNSGRWRSENTDCLYLKLSESSAILKFEKPGYGEFFLVLSCLGKKATLDLITRQDWYYGTTPTADILKRAKKDMPGFKRQTSNFMRIKANRIHGLVPSIAAMFMVPGEVNESREGFPFLVTLRKEGGDSDRKIYDVKLGQT